MVTLDHNIRLVSLQFSFSNPGVIPASVKRLERETADEMIKRKSQKTGILVIQPVENVSLVEFLHDLEKVGFEMVDAFYKERIDRKDPRGNRTYHMVRFLFARHEFVNISDVFKKAQRVVRDELKSICEVAMWRVRVFSNPFYKNGEQIPNQRALSINLEARKPLFAPDGKPITIWQKDGDGWRIGEAPVPIQADFQLRIIDDTIGFFK